MQIIIIIIIIYLFIYLFIYFSILVWYTQHHKYTVS
jgi:hypothetical protein